MENLSLARPISFNFHTGAIFLAKNTGSAFFNEQEFLWAAHMAANATSQLANAY